ncbi:MAG: ADP-heptose--LPS heptosyltransferase [Ignavibacteria bacterium]|nr:MAG: ADP-heptose--LPS heptosyltransferase [Ignavibacteria bacterium]KAF0157959.1 MAG: ADP-heptose--LPS heptosyltransferase [Ignavibacteria bacterium]
MLTTPIVRVLKNKFGDAQIHFAVRREFADVYTNNPNIAKVIIFDKANEAALKLELIKENYQLIIDLQNNWRSRKLTRGISSNILMYVKPTFAKLLLVHLKINLLKENISIVQRYAEAASVELDENGLDLFVSPETKTKLEKDGKYIGFTPGAKHFTKRWLPEYFVELGCELYKLGYQIVLFGGKSDKELCADIAKQIPDSINLQNEDILHQTAAGMKMCKFVVTNDSGLMHTAAAAHVPLVSIFGSTVKEFGFLPYGIQNLILENNSLFCRPCSHIGKSTCPEKHFKCMKDITPHIVLNHLQKLLPQL